MKISIAAWVLIASGMISAHGRVGELAALDQLKAAAAPEAPAPPITPAAASSREIDNPWSKIEQPAPGPAQSIGGYSGGCLRGAQQLSPSFPEFITMKPKRKRFFGHPALLQFIQTLGKKLHSETEETLLVGDMGQARGGPSFSGHASHQTGLDVDIWLWRPEKGKNLSDADRNGFSAPQMAKRDFEGLTKNWKPEHILPIQRAAEDPRSQRILINPLIKMEVCKAHKGKAWVAKLRPWWGHTDHMHVRLSCPEGDALCEKQEDVPEGDGCDATLDHWISPEMKAKSKYLREHPEPPKMPTLPGACSELLK